jgi:hypothetical protein
MSKTSLPKLAETPKSGQNGGLKTSLQGLRIRPEELPEITHNCWRDWDEILMVLKEYFRRHFQDLESICPDPMMITNVPKYVSYTLPVLDAASIVGLNELTDPMGIQRQTVLLVFRTQLSSISQKRDKQALEKASVYRVIRSMCSPQVLPAFLAVPMN